MMNEMLEEMASVSEPWGLFEPHLWRDKIGDGKWHCYIQSVCAQFAESTGDSPEEAVEKCYKTFKSL